MQQFKELPKHFGAFAFNHMNQHSVIFDEFVNVKAGEPYRLFPFGKIIKNGKVREITPEYAATIKLPHFKPAIKLGSHEDATPAGGRLMALEVHSDGYASCELCAIGKCKVHGLFVVPELNDKGSQALEDRAYWYHSPEIIWEGGLENPDGSGVISAPLIVGDAWLHTPHLGESAALYSVEVIEPKQEQNNMDNVQIPQSFWDKFIAPILEKKQEVKVETVEKLVEPEDYSALKSKVQEYEVEKQKMQAAADKKARVEKFDAELKETKADPTLAELLADVPEETAQAVMKQFRALSEQINESNITGEKGSPADGNAIDDPKAAFNAVVLGISNSKHINYNAAMEEAKVSHKDLFLAWAKK